MANQQKRLNTASAQISYTGNPDKDSNNKNNKQNPDIPKHRYIPSTKPVKLKDDNVQDKEIEKLLKRLDKAEKAAYTTLSDKF
jgi:hypothetical protein